MNDMGGYELGIQAFLDGLSSASCPYPHVIPTPPDSERGKWFNGWYDAWRITKHGPNDGEEPHAMLAGK